MRTEPFAFDPTAFMSGQTLSKLWLCEELERLSSYDREITIWLLGGWYGLTNLLLRSRDQIPVKKVISYDLDPQATLGAQVLNEAFVFLEEFEARTEDVNMLDYSAPPDLVINTSCEHMLETEWFNRIPKGTRVLLQSNDMPHEDHIFNLTCSDDLLLHFPLTQIDYMGELPFIYTDWSFRRFMTIGTK